MDYNDVSVTGIDLSLNHGAAITINGNGKLIRAQYFTDKAGSAARSSDGTRLLLNSKEKQSLKMERLAWIERWLIERVFMPVRPKYVGIEDYAIRAEQGAHYLGEAGGIARIIMWHSGVSFRLHDPISVKMFATHDGTAQKDAVERAVFDRWGQNFDRFNQPPPKKGKPNRQTSEDMADAYAIAQLVALELKLRNGDVRLNTLHPKEIQVFNRVTKTYPTSLLDREWLCNVDGSFEKLCRCGKELHAKIELIRAKWPAVGAYLARAIDNVVIGQ